MPRLTDSSGVVVSVTDEKAERLVKQGWSPVDEPKKAPAKKAASSKPSTTKK